MDNTDAAKSLIHGWLLFSFGIVLFLLVFYLTFSDCLPYPDHIHAALVEEGGEGCQKLGIEYFRNCSQSNEEAVKILLAIFAVYAMGTIGIDTV